MRYFADAPEFHFPLTVKSESSLDPTSGSGVLILRRDGTMRVRLTQTFGGSVEGRLSSPIEADVEVLRAVVAAADELKTKLPDIQLVG